MGMGVGVCVCDGGVGGGCSYEAYPVAHRQTVSVVPFTCFHLLVLFFFFFFDANVVS